MSKLMLFDGLVRGIIMYRAEIWEWEKQKDIQQKEATVKIPVDSFNKKKKNIVTHSHGGK